MSPTFVVFPDGVTSADDNIVTASVTGLELVGVESGSVVSSDWKLTETSEETGLVLVVEVVVNWDRSMGSDPTSSSSTTLGDWVDVLSSSDGLVVVEEETSASVGRVNDNPDELVVVVDDSEELVDEDTSGGVEESDSSVSAGIENDIPEDVDDSSASVETVEDSIEDSVEEIEDLSSSMIEVVVVFSVTSVGVVETGGRVTAPASSSMVSLSSVDDVDDCEDVTDDTELSGIVNSKDDSVVVVVIISSLMVLVVDTSCGRATESPLASSS